jgi:hypothetical protein
MVIEVRVKTRAVAEKTRVRLGFEAAPITEPAHPIHLWCDMSDKLSATQTPIRLRIAL